jgi:PAS domain S-box-containing protein
LEKSTEENRINDVSETKEREKENRRWASALQQSDEAVCVFDAEGHIEFANDAFCHNVRLSPTDIVGWSAMNGWDKTSTQYTSFTNSMRQETSWSGRHRRYRADQTSYEALTSITPIRDEQGGLSFIAVHRDISEMVSMEEQLRHSQKMEAVGLLVSGIAHDFNNVLAGMLGNLYLIRTRLKDAPELAERIESVEQQGYGAAGMVRQLLSFSRKDLPDVKDIDLAPFTKELAKFAQVSVPENIEFICNVDNRVLITSCDPAQLQQSLLNLIVNATHAVMERNTDNGDSKGRIELSAQRVESPQWPTARTDLSPSTAQAWTCIRVRDNGIGMDQSTLERIFEPFFTTKPSDTGTGLGLAMVKGYIDALGGVIDVESTPGSGTCMSVYLPLSVGVPDDAHEKTTSLRQGKGELILVADDNTSVLEALSSILESINYRVLKASNGEHAMQLFNEHAEQLDMAILDMVMPKASGMQAARHMSSKRKDFKVVLMTGYDKQEAILSEKDMHYPILRKPWQLTNLNDVLITSLPK